MVATNQIAKSVTQKKSHRPLLRGPDQRSPKTNQIHKLNNALKCALDRTHSLIWTVFFYPRHSASLFQKIFFIMALRRFMRVWIALTHFQIHFSLLFFFFFDQKENLFVNCHLAWWIPDHLMNGQRTHTQTINIFLNKFFSYTHSFFACFV